MLPRFCMTPGPPFIIMISWVVMGCDMIWLVITAAALAPSAICDMRSRSVPVWSLYMAWAAGGISITYQMFWGNMPWWPAGAAAAMGVGSGILLILLSRRAMLGSADGHVMGAASVMLPWCNDIPLALCGMAAGCAAALAWMVATNIWYNLRDMAGGRPVPYHHIFTCHRKRAGETFAVAARRRGPVHVDDANTIRDAEGDLFEPPESEGVMVRPVAPLASFVAGGVCALASHAVLASHVL